jgi:hypothetical protein
MLNRLTTAIASCLSRGTRRALATGLGALALAGCAQPWTQFHAGDDLMWPTQPMGETTVAADIDAHGKVVNVRQVLQVNEFYRAEIGKWTRADVLVNFGRPVETSYFPLMKREVWTYRYMEDNVWYMLYSFYFDHDGILRLMQKTPDPLHDPDVRSRF